jgi:hypothetical protein
MRKKKLIYVLIFFSAFTLCCKKDEVIPLTLKVTPGFLVFSSKAGNVIQFTAEVTSPTELKNFSITSKTGTSFTQTLLDSTIAGIKKFKMTYEYLIQNSNSDYSVILNFRVIDIDGAEISSARQINVVINNSPLTEYTGNTFYSLGSAKADAYDLVNLSPEFSTIAAVGIRDLQNSSDYDTSFTLARSWISPAGGKFVSYNGFDYVNATKLSLENAYLTGVQQDKISNLQEDDIILTRLGRSDSVIYAAIKIIYIIDQDSSKNDRYVFSLKK